MKAEASQVEEVLNCLARYHEGSKQTINGSTSSMMLSKNVNSRTSSVLKNFKPKESFLSIKSTRKSILVFQGIKKQVFRCGSGKDQEWGTGLEIKGALSSC